MTGAILVALFAAAAVTLVGDFADRALGHTFPFWSVLLGALALAGGLAVAVGT
jgi:hypothetical protein